MVKCLVAISTICAILATAILIADRVEAGGSQSAPLKYSSTSQVAQGASDNQGMRGDKTTNQGMRDDKTISEFSSSSAPVPTPPWLVAPVQVPNQCWVKTDDRGFGYYAPCQR